MSGTPLPLGLLSAFSLFMLAGSAHAATPPAPDHSHITSVVSDARALRPAMLSQTRRDLPVATAGRSTKDRWLEGVVAAMLVAYQLRRKHRALRIRPFTR